MIKEMSSDFFLFLLTTTLPNPKKNFKSPIIFSNSNVTLFVFQAQFSSRTKSNRTAICMGVISLEQKLKSSKCDFINQMPNRSSCLAKNIIPNDKSNQTSFIIKPRQISLTLISSRFGVNVFLHVPNEIIFMTTTFVMVSNIYLVISRHSRPARLSSRPLPPTLN